MREFAALFPTGGFICLHLRELPPTPSPRFSDAASVVPNQYLKLHVCLAIGRKETDQ